MTTEQCGLCSAPAIFYVEQDEHDEFGGMTLCERCWDEAGLGVTPVTDTVVWADDVWDRAIAAMNDLHDWYSTHGQEPGAPQALTAMADSIRLAANDVANLRRAWDDYMAHVGKITAHRITATEAAVLTENLRGL